MCIRDSAKGEAKILKACTLPLTGKGVVSKIITDLAIFEVTQDGLTLVECAPDVTVEEVRQKTDAEFIAALG